MGFLDENGLELLWANIMTLINSKISTIEVSVTKVNGKTGEVVLTASDVGALPDTTVIPSIAGLATETYVNNATAAVKNDLLNGAGAAYDTLKELGDLIDDNTDALEALETTASNKMNKANPTGTGSFSLNRKAGTAIGVNSFTEGRETTASGNFSHAEGGNTTASGNMSHAEGSDTIASGLSSHAEGTDAIAKGDSSHAENNGKAYGQYSHAEGSGFATGAYSHVEGSFGGTIYSGIKLTGEINATTYTYTGTPKDVVVIGNRARIDGNNYAQIIDIDTINKTITVDQTLTPLQAASESSVSIERSRASGVSSHAEGGDTIASGDYSHAEGDASEALGLTSHAEGCWTVASGAYSHSEGNYTRAYGWGSHTGGLYTKAYEAYSTAIGKYNYANQSTYYYSSSEKKTYVYYNFNTQYQIFTGAPTQNLSTGTFTYPELTTVTGADIVEGTQIYVNDSTFYVATTQEQTSSSWNRWTVTVHRIKSSAEDVGIYALMVGNGTSNSDTTNALALDWDGNTYLMGDVYVASTGRGQNGTKLAKEPFVINFNAQDGTNFTADKTFATALAAYKAGQPLKGKIYGTIESQFLLARIDDPTETDTLVFGLNIGDESLMLMWFADNTISVEMAQLVTTNNLPEESTAITSAEIDSICV